MPIFCYDQQENTKGLFITSAFFCALNAAAYFGMKHMLNKIDKEQSQTYIVAFGRFQQLLDKSEEYIR